MDTSSKMLWWRRASRRRRPRGADYEASCQHRRRPLLLVSWCRHWVCIAVLKLAHELRYLSIICPSSSSFFSYLFFFCNLFLLLIYMWAVHLYTESKDWYFITRLRGSATRAARGMLQSHPHWSSLNCTSSSSPPFYWLKSCPFVLFDWCCVLLALSLLLYCHFFGG